MAKTSLFQKFIYVVLICTLLIKVVSAFDDENALDEHINDPEIDTDNKEDDIEDMKMPHIDAKKERPIEKVDIPKIIHQYGNNFKSYFTFYLYIHTFINNNLYIFKCSK